MGSSNPITKTWNAVVNSNPITKAVSDGLTSASDAIGLKKPLDDAVKSVSKTLTDASDAIGLKQPLDDLGKGLMPQPPKIETPTTPAMPDMGQTIGMAGGDTMSAGGEFDLGEDEDEQAVRSRRKKRRGRREMIGEGVGLSAGTSDVGVKI
jgi:hypothetical protein